MGCFGELERGEVDFSDWDFGCGPFNAAVAAAAKAKIKEALAELKPYIYFPALSQDDRDRQPQTPALTIRLWLDALGPWNDDAGPQYEFSLEEMLRDLAIDGEPNAKEIITALRVLATELEVTMVDSSESAPPPDDDPQAQP